VSLAKFFISSVVIFKKLANLLVDLSVNLKVLNHY